MSMNDIIAVPMATVLLAFLGWLARACAAYFRAKAVTEKETTHNLRLVRVADGVNRIASEIAGDLAELPPGANFAAVKARLVTAGVDEAKERFAATIDNLGGTTDKVLTGMVKGELNKLTSAPAAAATVAITEAAAMVTKAADVVTQAAGLVATPVPFPEAFTPGAGGLTIPKRPA